MLALTVAQGEQEFDQRTLQSHQAPHTGSNLLYKNALLDRARTIFSGLIIVDPEAQKTDAYQSNRNLLLSDDAETNSLPVWRSRPTMSGAPHGATSGHVDAEQMFYLESAASRQRQRASCSSSVFSRRCSRSSKTKTSTRPCAMRSESN